MIFAKLRQAAISKFREIAKKTPASLRNFLRYIRQNKLEIDIQKISLKKFQKTGFVPPPHLGGIGFQGGLGLKS